MTKGHVVVLMLYMNIFTMSRNIFGPGKTRTDRPNRRAVPLGRGPSSRTAAPLPRSGVAKWTHGCGFFATPIPFIRSLLPAPPPSRPKSRRRPGASRLSGHDGTPSITYSYLHSFLYVHSPTSPRDIRIVRGNLLAGTSIAVPLALASPGLRPLPAGGGILGLDKGLRAVLAFQRYL